MYINKNRYLAAFSFVVLILAVVRLIFPSIADNKTYVSENDLVENKTTKEQELHIEQDRLNRHVAAYPLTLFYDNNGKKIKNRINSVPGFSKTFPDNNDVQMEVAKCHGVSPVENRADAEKRKKELVYIGSNPYFHVDPLRSSIPYLIPRAANLLNDIGRAYYDSLQIKGIPLHQIIVTSVLRSREDIKKLRWHNGNATENSCHLYGTTFDVCYNRYKTVSDPDGKKCRAVRNDTLKWVLSEVLRDMRENGRCFVKYEVKQGCFHITVR